MIQEIEQAISQIVEDENYLDFDLGKPKPRPKRKREPDPTGRLSADQIQVGSEYIAHGEEGEDDHVKILSVRADSDYDYWFNVNVRFLSGPAQGRHDSWYLSHTDRMFEPVD